MRHGAAIIAFVTAGLVSGSACAMTKDGTAGPECIVTGGEKLSAETGPEAICEAVRQALAGRSSSIKVTVRVTSPYALTAEIEKGGVALPEQNFSISDSKLTKGSILRFAQAIAEAVDRAS